MKMKVVASMLCMSLSCLAVQTSYAAASMPEKCPSVSAIQSVGVNIAEQARGTWFAGVLSNSYDTSDAWTFVIGPFSGTDKDDVLSQATNSLQTLTFIQGPENMDDSEEQSFCLYTADDQHYAVAVTPALGFSAARHALRLSLHK